MASRRAAKPRRSPKSSAKGASKTRRVPVHQVIAGERMRLLEASALLKCLYEVLLYEAGETALYADVAKVAQRILDEVIDRLDDLGLGRMVAAAP